MLLNIESTFGQDEDYIANGDASLQIIAGIPDPGGDCEDAFTLTTNRRYRSGAVWRNRPINIRNGFKMNTRMYFGNSPVLGAGADGITFTMQRSQVAVGGTGGWLGIGNAAALDRVSPSVSIEFDTWLNNGTNQIGDIVQDHVDIIYNGDVFENPDRFPATAFPNNANIEDGTWHDVEINFTPCNENFEQCITVIFDEDTIINRFCDNFIEDVFGGDPTNITWGFTSATGNITNFHAVCMGEVEFEYCCDAASNSDYFRIAADTDPALLADYGITFHAGLGTNGTDHALIAHNDYISLPSKVYVDDNVTLQVRGTGSTLDLTNCDMVFGTCAGLEAFNGGEIKAYNSVFRPCNENVSWRGVLVTRSAGFSDNSQVSFKECTFINADIGIHTNHLITGSGSIISEFSDINIQDNLFTNCRVGIRINGLLPEQSIAGNKFVIDNVDDIDFYNTNCELANINSYVGIEYAERWGIIANHNILNIHQNDFINATAFNSQSEYIGISVNARRLRTDITANHFTNMRNSISVRGDGIDGFVSSIADNVINVSRRFSVRDRGDAQILLNNGNQAYEIVNNTITSTADAPHVSFANAANHVFMQSAIEFRNRTSGPLLIRENTITGFEVGIFADSSSVYHLLENTIRADYYGIYVKPQEHIGHFLYTNTLGVIKCNDIEMDLEPGTTSVGIAIDFYNTTEYSEDILMLYGNCIKNSTRAIEINGDARILQTKGVYKARILPNMLNNYLYNYAEVGILIRGDFDSKGMGLSVLGTQPHIGGFSGRHTEAPQNGMNSFISNNEDNGVSDIQYLPATLNVPTATLVAVNNDFGNGGTALVSSNVDINQADVAGFPSFAKCGNQEANFNTGFTGGLTGSNNIFLCGYSPAVLTETNPQLLAINNLNEAVLHANYLTSVLKLSAADESGKLILSEALNAFELLSDKTEINTLYQSVLNENVLEDNQIVWLTYGAKKAGNDFEAAKLALQSIMAESIDEDALKIIQLVKLELALTGRTLFELSEVERTTLKSITGGQYAVTANDMADFETGKRVNNFDALPLASSISNTRIERINLSEVGLDIYPNPTDGLVNIEFRLDQMMAHQLNIFNVQGQLMFSEAVNGTSNTIAIDLSDLTNGIYFVSIHNENGLVKTSKLIKE